MGVPAIYRKSGEGAIASYDYFDIAEGTGIKIFYAAVGTNTNAPPVDYKYLLSANTVFTQTRQATVQTTVPLTFALAPFNTPKIIKGGAFATFSIKTTNTGTLTLEIQKNTTTIATEIIRHEAATSTIYAEFTIPSTVFKKGDYLALKLSCADVNFIIGVDPLNRDATDIIPSTSPQYTTQLKLYIPFNIDL